MTGILKHRNDFERVYSSHYRYPGKCFVLLVHRDPGEQTRAGIVVSKKIGNAVVRNKVKRRTRASIRSFSEYGMIGRDMLLIARTPAGSASWAEINGELTSHLRHCLTRFSHPTS
jgi:ribonuclease P protein component